MEAVILAGSPNDGALRVHASEPWEALVRVGARTMLERVAGAFLALPVDRLVIVAARSMVDGLQDGRVVRTPSGRDMLDNVARGLACLQSDAPAFVATSDIPLLTPDSLVGIQRAASERPGYQLYFPIVRKETFDRWVPGARRTFVRMREGVFTTGNVVLAEPEALLRSLGRASELVRLRKHPLKLAGLFGAGFLLRLLTKRLTIADAERRFRSLMGISVAAVEVDDAGIGMDVDKVDDLVQCEAILTRRDGREGSA